MDIRIVGGGPAGLYFAILMKRRDPAHRVTVWEKNAPDDTFGWGLVFSEKTLRGLQEADPDSFAEIEGSFQRWEDVVVVHRGETVRIGGNRFAGLGRLELLGILQRRCETLGVDVRYRQGVEDPSELQAADLLVGADGVGSRVRQRWEKAFRPEREVRPNRYIWLGTPHLFHGLTLTFRQTEAGPFAAHSYKYNRERSTFIVECAPEVMERAGLGEMDERQTLDYLARVFAEDLDGAPLLSNQSRWLRFTVLKNERWSHENVVLLGDALHTAHFSIGSGTKLAMEDSIALAEALDGGGSVREALVRFEESRRPGVEDVQLAARKSMIWFENFQDDLDLEPLPFAGRIMTRSPKVNMENLRRRDPAFVAAWEAWLASG